MERCQMALLRCKYWGHALWRCGSGKGSITASLCHELCHVIVGLCLCPKFVLPSTAHSCISDGEQVDRVTVLASLLSSTTRHIRPPEIWLQMLEHTSNNIFLFCNVGCYSFICTQNYDSGG